jgi:hypothetical protein
VVLILPGLQILTKYILRAFKVILFNVVSWNTYNVNAIVVDIEVPKNVPV